MARSGCAGGLDVRLLTIMHTCTCVRCNRAGARRYLIRIETSNPDLYAALHPEPMSWHARVECLRNLKKVRACVSVVEDNSGEGM